MKLFLSVILLVFLHNPFSYGQNTVSSNVSTFDIKAPQLQSVKKIWIYLPQEYLKNTTAYKVVYMHDAQNLFDAQTSYAGEWEIDEYLDNKPELNSIIIGIEHGNEKRMEELTPFKNAAYGGGQADAYLDFIVNTLKPHVDSTYRTMKTSEHTSIIGSSLGGLLSLYATLKHPETFGNAGVFSASFWFNPEIFDLAATMPVPKDSRFYFLAGTEESDTMAADQQRMVALLKSNGVSSKQLKQELIEGGQHNERLWRENFPAAYTWLVNR